MNLVKYGLLALSLSTTFSAACDSVRAAPVRSKYCAP